MKFLKIKKILKILGPGFITGAADDDPSGVAIYAQTGAASGFDLIWTAPLTLPLMASLQEMCGRIGLVTGHGLAGILRRFYSKKLLYLIAFLIIFSNTINIGADIAGIAASLQLVLPISKVLMSIIFVAVELILLVRFGYKAIAKTLKWLSFFLFAYLISGIMVISDWKDLFFHTIFPTFKFNKENFFLITALFGTTVSPYLFFWQTSEEVEERRMIKIITKNELKLMREDTFFGMFLSNTVTFFIIATSAVTLHNKGVASIDTAYQASLALKPLAGNFASLLFTLGIVGVGTIAIPILAGSAAYAVSEVFGWKASLDLSFHRARSFYLVIFLSALLGLAISISGIHPFKALYFAGVVFAIISPLLIFLVLHVANNKRIMGNKTNGFWSNFFGALTLIFSLITVFAYLLSILFNNVL